MHTTYPAVFVSKDVVAIVSLILEYLLLMLKHKVNGIRSVHPIAAYSVGVVSSVERADNVL
jgi:hypothetical protein